MGLLQQKRYYNKLIELLQKGDSLGIEIDAELVKSKGFDRLALMLAGMSATLSMVSEQIGYEIATLEDRARMDREFERIFKEEQDKFERKERIKPALQDEDEPGGTMEGM